MMTSISHFVNGILAWLNRQYPVKGKQQHNQHPKMNGLTREAIPRNPNDRR